ncbi:thioesterase II family protein [Catenuloplanes atrovinosus]|uniref:Medium-chain acyl-[acyl-carrier-protein] hydrolase n=1 Tax=Catenuloplanes atrovinosus TaxID=137266 RepID=A0AAE4C920_9ACTN|nr:thioesterase domain-containing protein [Catenuloplanes atrovinosus]MDR7275593.1 medium-chain acyl-[acyl-carrier-protein] hydrolase [Catenuloplanes atrovinosus]
MSETIVHLTGPRDELPQLLCLGQAGSGAAEFRSWSKQAEQLFDVSAVRLPGRETRGREAYLPSLPAVVDEIVEQFLESLGHNRRFALYGQCAGVPPLLEMVRELDRRGAPKPVFLAISGFPWQPSVNEPDFEDLSRAETIEYLLATNLVPAAVLSRPAYYDVFVGPIIADSRIVRGYRPADGARLSVPLIVVGAATDGEDWGAVTAERCVTVPAPPGTLPSREPGTSLLQLFADLLTGGSEIR